MIRSDTLFDLKKIECNWYEKLFYWFFNMIMAYEFIQYRQVNLVESFKLPSSGFPEVLYRIIYIKYKPLLRFYTVCCC